MDEQRLARDAEVQCVVLLHSKHQVVAQAFREASHEPPLVVTPRKFTWSDMVAKPTSNVPQDWFSTFWHHRMVVRVSGRGAADLDELLETKLDLSALKGATLDPNSLRVVEVDQSGNAVAFPLLIFDAKSDIVSWLPPKRADARGERDFHIYYDSIDNGPKPPPRAPSSFPVNALVAQSFESDREMMGWSFGGADIDINNAPISKSIYRDRGNAHTGKRCIRLHDGNPASPSLMTNNAIRVQPSTAYRVTFWAKVQRGVPELRTNFYNGPEYDFEQMVIHPTTDNEWHQYRCTLPAHDFPVGTPLAFRLWTLTANCSVLVDDVEVKPELEGPPTAKAEMKVLRVKSI